VLLSSLPGYGLFFLSLSPPVFANDKVTSSPPPFSREIYLDWTHASVLLFGLCLATGFSWVLSDLQVSVPGRGPNWSFVNAGVLSTFGLGNGGIETMINAMRLEVGL